jgi:DNA invertase Pin-like site-specific DNA recombinase
MGRRNTKRLPPKAGWALYLRTSSEEAQNPENSQRRQRHTIQRALFERTDLPVYNEYIDNLSGRYADNRPGFQQMLEDARAGLFSHVAVENAERFGRNDTEALVAIDALHELGIAIRFADYPDLDPIDPDDRILVSLSFTLARRESMKLGQRVTGGLHAKLRSGGFVGKAPDGYINCEEKSEQLDKSKAGRYLRWIEPDPEQINVWRTAWDLLLTDQYTLAGICEELHSRGWRFRSGRSFVTIHPNGTRKQAANHLSRIFKNWFYAGWVVSEKASIPPKTVRGQWKPLLTTEEFERGLEILAGRQKHRLSKVRVHDYLLRGLVYVELDNGRCRRLTGSTPNASRPGGGTPYYCIESSGVNIQCRIVDSQIPTEMLRIQVDPDMLPLIRDSYTDEIADRLGRIRPSQRADMERQLKDVDDEEARALRLYTMGKITDSVWNGLWEEWQDRRRSLRHALRSLEARNEVHVASLDAALKIITKVGILYCRLERDRQNKLLREMVKRVVVNPEGTILRMELLPPFAYLKEVTDRVRQESEDPGRNGKTSMEAGLCSRHFSSGSPNGTRTRVSALKGQRPGPLDDGAVRDDDTIVGASFAVKGRHASQCLERPIGRTPPRVPAAGPALCAGQAASAPAPAGWARAAVR